MCLTYLCLRFLKLLLTTLEIKGEGSQALKGRTILKRETYDLLKNLDLNLSKDLQVIYSFKNYIGGFTK